MVAVPGGVVESPGYAEEDVFRQLAALDITGARATMRALLSETLATCHQPTEAACLLFDLLSHLQRQISEFRSAAPLTAGKRLEVVRQLNAARTEAELILAFWSEWDSVTAFLESDAHAGHPAVAQVRSFIQANYQRKIALSEIAKAVGISRNYLSHIFRRHSGVTVTEHIHRTRMKQAEQLLLSGERTVSEIAYMTGYQNYRDFHRNFVKYRKTSPKRFRQARSRIHQKTAAAL